MPSWSLPSASQPKIVVTQLAQSKVIAQLSPVLPNAVLPFHTQVVDSPHQPACAMLPTQLDPFHTMVRPLQSSAIMLCLPKYQHSLLVSPVLLSTCENYENENLLMFRKFLCLRIKLKQPYFIVKSQTVHIIPPRTSFFQSSSNLLPFIYI